LEVSNKDAIILVYIAGHYKESIKECDILIETLGENAKIVADKLIRSIFS